MYRKLEEGEWDTFRPLDEDSLLKLPIGTTIFEAKYDTVFTEETITSASKRADGKFTVRTPSIDFLFSRPSKLLVKSDVFEKLENTDVYRTTIADSA